MALVAATVVGLSAVVAGGSALLLARNALDDALRDGLDVAASRTVQHLVDLGDGVEAALERGEDLLRGPDARTLEAALAGRRSSSGAARRLARAVGLERIEIAGATGQLLLADSSREGLSDPSVASLHAGRAVLRAEAGTSGPAWRIVGARDIDVAGRSVRLVGWASIAPRQLDANAGGAAAWLVGEGPSRTILGADRPQVDEAELVRHAATDEIRRLPAAGGTWIARALPLPLAGAGRLVVAVDATALDEVSGRLGRRLALVAILAAAAAAAVTAWAGGRVGRRMEALVEAVDRVAAGEADYDFSGPRLDEVDELAAAFSRSHRAAEEQRRRSVAAERVAAWSDVARRVAHEVKNPLAPIRLTVQNLARARRRAPERFDALFEDGARTILEEVEQLSRMVGEFSEFARLPLPRPEPVELGRLVDAAVELWAGEPRIAVRRVGAGDGPRMRLDRDQLARVLKNVIGNAVEAIRERDDDGADGRVEVRTRVDGGEAVIEVVDDGPGLGAEAARRLFEPSFTTKPGGSGLGLAITYRIVTEHGGRIEAADRSEGGARVTIRLPLVAAVGEGGAVR